MAALVDRSPCDGSRGGSTTNRPRSRLGGRLPVAIRFFTSAATRAWKSAKMFTFHLSRKRGRLPQVRRAVKKTGVLVDRETVGHSCYIVGNRSRALALPGLLRPGLRHC